MKLCTFEAGLPPEQLHDRYPTYPAMIENWLAPQLPEASFSALSSVRGERPPDPDAYDGYLITGSRYGVYDKLPWMVELREFLQAARDRRRPVFGICFGHQLMAEAYGGRVVKSDLGWNIGVQTYRATDTGSNATAPSGPTLVFHQDQVIKVPPQASVIGDSERCAVGMLSYDFPALSVQYHPEFSAAYVAELINLVEGDRISHEVAERSRASLTGGPVDAAAVAVWAARFFRRAWAAQNVPVPA